MAFILQANQFPAGRTELAAEYSEKFASVQVAEARGFVDAVIEPAETRAALVRALRATVGKREELPYKKNGNIPL